MKIEDSAVTLQSQHKSVHLEHKQSTLEIGPRDIFERNDDTEGVRDPSRRRRDLDSVARSPRALAQRAERMGARMGARMKHLYSIEDKIESDLNSGAIKGDELSITGDSIQDAKLLIFAIMISKLTGKPVYLSRIGAQMSEAMERIDNNDLFPPNPHAKTSTTVAEVDEEPIFRYEEETLSFEAERLSVQGGGFVRTEEGREIDFEVELNFDRYAQSRSSLVITNERLKDPLVLDFGSRPAQFTDETMRFDIDADGALDDLPILDSHGGVLVIDHNQDGEINDGTEVVGALSGDGFADLRALDQDQNQWLDEGDDAFQKLRLWTWDEDGESHLSGLMEMGVGAIYLGAVQAQFTQKDDAQNTVAQQQALSVYLRESGEAGSIRQVDVTA
jgi:hypothetical protein